jgi:cell division ATPase FtsA
VRPDEPLIVLDIGASHTDLIFVDGRRFWIRPLPHSGNDVTRAIMSRFRLDFAEAERLKIETAKVPKQAVKIFQAVIQPKLQELVQEVHRSIGYYRSQTGEIKFTRLLLMGNGSKIIGIKKYLEEHLRIPVERLSSISRLRVNRDVKVRKLQADLPAFGTALGCGVQAVGAGACRVDLVPREEKVRKEIDRKKKHVYFAAGILFLCILISFALLNKKIQRAENALNTVDSYYRTEQILKWEREARSLKGESETGYDARTETLRGIGEARQGAVAALRALENVVVAIPNEEHVDAVVQKLNQEAIDKLLTEAREQLSEKLWIPYLKVSLIDYPEDPTAGAARARRRKEEKPTAPAYKVTAYAVITARESDTASNQAISTLLEAPLEGQLKELKVRKLTELPQVTIAPGEDTVPAVYHSPARRGGITEVPLQEGGPFYGAEVEWYMLPRLPEEPPAEGEESEEE